MTWRWRAVWLVAMTVGCGRLGYDETSPTSGQDGGALGGLVQSGSAQILDSDQTTNVTIEPIDLASSFLVFGASADSVEPDDVQVRGELAAADTVSFSRIGTEGVVELYWYVVSTKGLATVSRDRVQIVETGATVDIDAIERGSTFPIVTMENPGTDFDENDLIRIEIASETQVLVDTGDNIDDADDPILDYQMVRIPGTTVLEGTVPLSNNATEITLSGFDYDPNRSVLIYYCSSDQGQLDNIADKLVRGSLVADSLGIQFSRGTTGLNIDLSWFIVELPAGFEVRTATASFATGELEIDVTIDTVDPARSFAMAGYSQRGGETDQTTEDTPGGAWATLEIVDATTLRLRRTNSDFAARFTYFVVQLPQ